MTVTLHLGDCVEWARQYSGEPFHALLCDPPYHLTSIVKRFGADNSAPAQFGKDGAFSRASAGFMGKQWDGGDLAFDPATWEAFGRIMYPGAFGMAFASSRGWHRLAVAIEDAGFVIHPSIFGWNYSTGFPKATRVDTQIDKANGRAFDERLKLAKYLKDTREARGLTRQQVNDVLGASLKCEHFESASPDFVRVPTPEDWKKLQELYSINGEWNYLIDRYGAEREVIGSGTSGKTAMMGGLQGLENGGDFDITAPATPLAAAFAGHRYGLQALKPALEPIIVFQKPYEGRPVDNITATGAGVLNVDGGRIGTGEDKALGGNNGQTKKEPLFGGGIRTIPQTDYSVGRWPANFFIDEEAARRLDEQSGTIRERIIIENGGDFSFSVGDTKGKRHQHQIEGKPSGASRFFFTVREQLDDADPVRYVAKASRRERDAGCETMPEQRIDGMVSILDSGNHGETGKPNKPIYSRNPHPTVKPLSLTRYLATLLLPPAEYAPRRIFVPFAGVASECIGAMQAGWEDVQGVELTEEYIPIARARVEHWKDKTQMVMP